ncbi:hypothetical protein ACPUVO_13090 [Pseudocolwellia sp. HL-MZ19]|uniref:hypothetical protein n=1 Tax=unclassified Pseudocolwellia TaxID=2848178 RepID=UPI003CF3AFDB
MSKNLVFLSMLLLSSPAYAHGGPPLSIVLGLLAAVIVIYLLPSILGCWLVGKENRSWFFNVALIIYSISIVLLLLSLKKANNIFDLTEITLTFYLLPFVLIIIAFIKRKARAI